MTTRARGHLKFWLLEECDVDNITGIKPLTNKKVYLHFRCFRLSIHEAKQLFCIAAQDAIGEVKNPSKKR